MKKKHARKIRKIKEVLGVRDFTVCTATIEMSGEDLLLSGYGTYPRTMDIDKSKTYLVDTDVLVATSYAKELKQAFKQGGMEQLTAVVKREHDRRVYGKK